MSSLITYSIDDDFEVEGTSEVLIQEWSHNFATQDDDTLGFTLTALAKAAGGSTGTFRVRVGGTIGGVDGTIVATLSAGSASYSAITASGTGSNPAAQTSLKLTGQVSVSGQPADIRGAVITLFSGAAPPAVDTGRSSTSPADDVDRFFGRDIWMDMNGTTGPDTIVTKKGDWLIATGPECLRQSLIRRFITAKGDWKFLPDYGAGARMYVRARNSKAARDELAENLRAQALLDYRVDGVEDVTVTQIEGGLQLQVVIIPKGRTARLEPLTVNLEIR